MKRITIHLALVGMAVFVLLVSPGSVVGQHYPLPKDPKASPAPKSKFIKHKKAVPNHYIVVLNDDVAPDKLSREERYARVKAIADEHARKYHGRVFYIYETALKGYSIELKDEADAIAISKLPIVRWVEEDAIGELAFGIK
jgi:hypothetical protein